MSEQLFDLSGRTVLVTGASRGLGRGMSLALAQAGARVVAASRNAETLEALRADIEGAGGVCIVRPTDVTDSEDVNALIAAAIAEAGRVDVLINNAGGLLTDVERPFTELSDAEWRTELALNLDAPFYTSRAILPHFVEQGGGRIVNVGSVGGMAAVGGLAAYGIAKAGLHQLTRSLALTYGRSGVRAVSLVIGNFPHDYSLDVREQQARFLPMGRNGEDEEIGPIAVFLCSEASDYLSGSEVVFDGGWSVGGLLPAGTVPDFSARSGGTGGGDD